MEEDQGVRFKDRMFGAGMLLLVIAGLGGIVLGVLALVGQNLGFLIFGTLGVLTLIFGGSTFTGWVRDSPISDFWVTALSGLLSVVVLFGSPTAAFLLYLALWGLIPAIVAAGLAFVLALIMVASVMSDGKFNGGGFLTGLMDIIADIW